MPRSILIAVTLLVLLVGVPSAAILNSSQDAHVSAEKPPKSELSRQTQYLQALEDEKRLLQGQLDLKGTGYNSEIVQLESKIIDLEERIEKLQDQLKCQNHVAVGLTFFWRQQLNVDASDLAKVVEWMDDFIWDEFCVYFFVYHAEPRDFMPATVDCSSGYTISADGSLGPEITWANEAWTEYPVRDIPMGIFSDVGLGIAGCTVDAGTRYVIAIRVDAYDPAVLLHELLHVFGFSEKELAAVRYGMAIPPEWSARIQTKAKWFQMKPPPTSE